MKRFIKVAAFCLALILCLSALVSCSGISKMNRIEKNIIELPNSGYSFARNGTDAGKSHWVSAQIELRIKFDEEIESFWEIKNATNICFVIEFEKRNDAKAFEKAYSERVADMTDPITNFDLMWFPEGVCFIERSGKVVIASNDEDLAKMIWQ